MKILIKGAGDLATGIAARLHACGYKIVMTEIAFLLLCEDLLHFPERSMKGKPRWRMCARYWCGILKEPKRCWKKAGLR